MLSTITMVNNIRLNIKYTSSTRSLLLTAFYRRSFLFKQYFVFYFGVLFMRKKFSQQIKQVFLKFNPQLFQV